MPRYLRPIAWLAVVALASTIPFMTDDKRVLTIAIQVCLLGSLASSWNILGGFAGQISLGHAAFFGTGALVTRELWLNGNQFALSMAIGVAVTAVAAAVVGVPMLRFRDIYFAIGTLAMAVAVALTIANVRPGISSLPVEALRNYGLSGPYYLAFAAVAATVLVAVLLRGSKLGLGMMVVRDDEEAAAATGVNVLGHKLAAFVISAALAAVAGGAFAYFAVSYYPQFPYGEVWTFEAILVVFIGGIGTIAGPLMGAAFFIVARDTLSSTFGDIQVILFGVLFIVVVVLLPGGMVEGGQRLERLASQAGARLRNGKETK
jgi:branched-chain amino acid transport system permease protein